MIRASASSCRYGIALTLLALAGCGPTRPPAAPLESTPFVDYLRRPDASMIAYTPSSVDIDDELKLLRSRFDGLILYGFDEKTPSILESAARLKYQAVLATVWDPRSDREIGDAARMLGGYAERFAVAVSIGSEGLLENRYSMGDLQDGAAKFDRLSRHRFEITTSEPWWRYLDGQPSAGTLRTFGDFLAIHVHVVWDADISDPEEAARWSRDRAVQIAALSGRMVLVREAGFPGAGRSPRASAEGLVFSREAQAKFWREWVRLRGQHDQNVSLAAAFEAIDNPRKVWRDFESSWGLFSTGDLRPWPAWDAFPELER